MKKIFLAVTMLFSVQAAAAQVTICQDGDFSQVVFEYGDRVDYTYGERHVQVRLSGPVSKAMHGSSFISKDRTGFVRASGAISFGVYSQGSPTPLYGLWEKGSKELVLRSIIGNEVWKFAHCRDFS